MLRFELLEILLFWFVFFEIWVYEVWLKAATACKITFLYLEFYASWISSSFTVSSECSDELIGEGLDISDFY